MNIVGLGLLVALGLLGAISVCALIAAAAQGVYAFVRRPRRKAQSRAAMANVQRLVETSYWAVLAFVCGSLLLALMPPDVDPSLSTLALVVGIVGGVLVVLAVSITKAVGAPSWPPALEGTRK